MSVALYLDANVSYAVAVGLRLRGVDLLTAQEDHSTELTDPKLLTRASKLRRVLFTHDDDLLREATRRQAEHEEFAGLVYAHQLSITIGQCINDLELIARASDPIEWANRIGFLPLG